MTKPAGASEREDATDIEAFFASLSSAHPGAERYSFADRYRDFRQLFLSSDQGRRVLHEILSWGHMFHASVPTMGVIDPYRVVVQEGERRIILKLFSTIHVEPNTARQTRANRTAEGGT